MEIKDCIEAVNEEGFFTVHLCTRNGTVEEGRIYSYLFTKYDANLDEMVGVDFGEEMGTAYDIPSNLLGNEEFINQLTNVGTPLDLIRTLEDWHVSLG